MSLLVATLKEHDYFLLVAKPAGLVVHRDGRTDEPTLTDWLLDQYPELAGVGEPMRIKRGSEEITIDRPGIVHRLDRDTSGVMVVARTQEAFGRLKSLFQNRQVQKTYLAIVYGQPKADQGTVEAPIGRSPRDFRRWSAQPGARGQTREAVTDWQVLARFGGDDGEPYSLMAFWPRTGRTHQIRVHTKYMHHPIVSDPLYAGKRTPALGFDRQALHAYQLRFDWDGQAVQAEAPVPADFQAVLDQYQLDLSALAKSA